MQNGKEKYTKCCCVLCVVRCACAIMNCCFVWNRKWFCETILYMYLVLVLWCDRIFGRWRWRTCDEVEPSWLSSMLFHSSHRHRVLLFSFVISCSVICWRHDDASKVFVQEWIGSKSPSWRHQYVIIRDCEQRHHSMHYCTSVIQLSSCGKIISNDEIEIETISSVFLLSQIWLYELKH